MFPAFDATGAGQRQLQNGSSFGGGVPSTLFNLYNVSASVSYTLDLFGGSRRQLEALRAQVDYQQFQLLATYLTLTSNIVTTAFAIASYEEQIKATEALIRDEAGQLSILEKQFRLGGIANTNVLTQRTLVNQSRATLPPLQKSLSQSRHAMATLLGEYPDTPIPSISLNKLRLPNEIPVTVPSQLVRQRPDVRAAEALLHAASAQIGVATANLFPQFNITGNFGWTAPVPSSLFLPLSKTWAMAGQLTQPLFHGGALFAQRRGAIDTFEQALANYKQVLLVAFQNTADSLRALETDARTFQAAKAAERDAYQSFKIISQQYRDGGVAYLDLLNAQQQYQATRITSIQAQAQRYADTAALYQSLGGGWWNRKNSQCPDRLNPINASLGCP
jgi:NodT family efflux transporter outer membrane factor (OMF) lipoprotein